MKVLCPFCNGDIDVREEDVFKVIDEPTIRCPECGFFTALSWCGRISE